MLLTHWRTVRTIDELNRYQEIFRNAPEREKEEIVRDMLQDLEKYRVQQQLEVIKPPQAEKPLIRARRSRKRRL